MQYNGADSLIYFTINLMPRNIIQSDSRLTFCTEEPLLLILKMVQLAWMIATRTRAAMQATTTYSFTLGSASLASSRSDLVLMVSAT